MFQGSWRDDVIHGKVCILFQVYFFMIVKAKDKTKSNCFGIFYNRYGIFIHKLHGM